MQLPNNVHVDPELVASCVAGASRIAELETMLSNAGFEQIRIEPKAESEEFIRE